MLPLQPRQDRPVIGIPGFAAMAVLVLLGSGAVLAQEGGSTLPALAGSDTSETSLKAKGFPWIAHSSADLFYLPAPASASGTQPYQISAYQAFTIQPLSFASFHAGWRLRETLAPGFSRPYREIFALKLLGTAELIRDHVFFTLGGSIPILDEKVAVEDTLALYRSMSEYSPLPTPDFVTPQGLQVGVFGRYRLIAWDLMAGVTYAQATRFEPVEGYPFNPGSRLDATLRALLETSAARHRWDFKASTYGEESTVSEAPAHQEGRLLQLRYAYLRASGRTAWQLGMGGSVKTPDANRLVRLRTALEPAESNDNLQRGYAEATWTWSPNPALLWRAYLAPKALLDWSTRESGHETEFGVSLGMRMWEVHRLRSTGTVLAGSFRGQDYLGLGMRVEFAFRHLGFQDIESQGDSGEGGN